MQDIVVREYVRTVNGDIFKIVGMKRNKDLTMYITDQYGQYSENVLKEDMKNHSRQINDLIEKGDVIKYKLNNLSFSKLGQVKEYRDATTGEMYLGVEGFNFNQIIIKKIYTKEQFQMMGYEVV